ncbi:MAG: RpiB/LacA/LacB family sugar-phosphate isomerase, partial [Actinobacteria bacterium]|nr:RpiB/LacA/LacB family sugar-phosphate isomerase [Actinomycetota bacterium]
MVTIGIGADDAALELKSVLVEHLKEKGYEVEDYSPNSKEEAQSEGVDYPDVAVQVAEAVAR